MLNGYDYQHKKLQLVFEKVKGDPKIEAILLVRGSIEAFRSSYEEKELKRQVGSTEYLCEKIYNVEQRTRTVIEDPLNFKLREVISYSHYLNKLLSLQGLLSFVVFLAILYQQ